MSNNREKKKHTVIHTDTRAEAFPAQNQDAITEARHPRPETPTKMFTSFPATSVVTVAKCSDSLRLARLMR